MEPSSIEQQRKLVTELPGPNSRALHRRRSAAVAPGVSSTLPLYIRQASGAILVDVDDNALIDLGSGIAVVGVGHATPAVVDAVAGQVGRFAHTCFMVTPYEGYVAVCEALNELAPGDLPKRTALFNSGAEAVENAVKVARYATGRQAVVVFDHAYHG
ncbi:MAG TPA: aminotransferase class III-fold pyridoxal phosphate-dependent enzyme, partial [Acidimicrobiales bacterium]|nr:aminotransferase class III-fold pyridoxal phosphate-dependent enzyme [Acidimicrobiales bacterium]